MRAQASIPTMTMTDATDFNVLMTINAVPITATTIMTLAKSSSFPPGPSH